MKFSVLGSFIFFFTLLCNFSSKSQSVIYNEPVVCDSAHFAKPGSYKIIHVEGSSESNIPPVLNITNDLLCAIESKRALNEVVEYFYSANFIIRIYPKNTANSSTSSTK